MWTAHRPAVAGVYEVGETRAAAVEYLKEALAELESYLREIGERAPGAGKR